MSLGENPTLTEEVLPNNKLKTWLVNYVGERFETENLPLENDQVTVENIVAVMATDFPEFLLAVAEENWVRGYHQALTDAEDGFKIREQELSNKQCENCDC